MVVIVVAADGVLVPAHQSTSSSLSKLSHLHISRSCAIAHASSLMAESDSSSQPESTRDSLSASSGSADVDAIPPLFTGWLALGTILCLLGRFRAPRYAHTFSLSNSGSSHPMVRSLRLFSDLLPCNPPCVGGLLCSGGGIGGGAFYLPVFILVLQLDAHIAGWCFCVLSIPSSAVSLTHSPERALACTLTLMLSYTPVLKHSHTFTTHNTKHGSATRFSLLFSSLLFSSLLSLSLSLCAPCSRSPSRNTFRSLTHLNTRTRTHTLALTNRHTCTHALSHSLTHIYVSSYYHHVQSLSQR
jgi:hypothetical protein